MASVFLGVGTNLGEREKNLELAKTLLIKNKQLKWICQSPVYETDPVGGPAQDKYLNAVWEIETKVPPAALLKELLSIENQMGRRRTVLNAPRIIDLDILFYGDQILQEPGLHVPHPRLHERWFVLKPLADIAPDFVHPILKKKVRELLEENFARNQKS